jgi:hypothetical protein
LVPEQRGDIVFGSLHFSRALWLLHNPRYTGAFVYGRTRQRKISIGGQCRYRRLPREEWKVFLPNAHPAYISWEQYEANQQTLRANACGYGSDRRRSPAREGVALLQGMVICGRCGDRMTVRYDVGKGHLLRTTLASAEALRVLKHHARSSPERVWTMQSVASYWKH